MTRYLACILILICTTFSCKPKQKDRVKYDTYNYIVVLDLSDRIINEGQLDRDIEFSQDAGYKTIYFPGGFTPQWTFEKLHVKPDRTISSFEEIPGMKQFLGYVDLVVQLSII